MEWVLVVIGIHFATDGAELHDIKLALFPSREQCESAGAFIKDRSSDTIIYSCGRMADGR